MALIPVAALGFGLMAAAPASASTATKPVARTVTLPSPTKTTTAPGLAFFSVKPTATNYPGESSPCMIVKDDKGKVKSSVWLTSTWGRSRNAKKQSVTRPTEAVLHVTGQALRAWGMHYGIPGHVLASFPHTYIVQPGTLTFRFPPNTPWALNKGHGSAYVEEDVDLEYSPAPLPTPVRSTN